MASSPNPQKPQKLTRGADLLVNRPGPQGQPAGLAPSWARPGLEVQPSSLMGNQVTGGLGGMRERAIDEMRPPVSNGAPTPFGPIVNRYMGPDQGYSAEPRRDSGLPPVIQAGIDRARDGVDALHDWSDQMRGDATGLVTDVGGAVVDRVTSSPDGAAAAARILRMGNSSSVHPPHQARQSPNPQSGAVQLDPNAVNGLLRRIAIGEGTDDNAVRSRYYTVGGVRVPFASGYDVPFNDGRYAAPDKPITQMTFKEVYALQDRMAANPANKRKSTPVGKYQFRKATLQELQQRLGIDENAKFDAAMQDRLAQAKLEERGLSRYVAGNLDGTAFQTSLHKEWASIAEPKTGRADKGQHLGTTTADIQSALRALRRQDG